jgi:hypothetical protein
VGAKGLCLVGPPRSGETSRVKYEPHGGKKKQDEVVDRSRCTVAAHNRSLHAGFAVVH